MPQQMCVGATAPRGAAGLDCELGAGISTWRSGSGGCWAEWVAPRRAMSAERLRRPVHRNH